MADKQQQIDKLQSTLRKLLREYKGDMKYLGMDQHNLQIAQTKLKNDNTDREAKDAVEHWQHAVAAQKKEAEATRMKIHQVKSKLAKLGVHTNTPGVR